MAKGRKGKVGACKVTELQEVTLEDKGVRENCIMKRQSGHYEDELPELIKGSKRSRKKKWASDSEHVYNIPRKLHNFQLPSPCIPELTRENIREDMGVNMEETIENRGMPANGKDRALQTVNNNNKYRNVCESDIPVFTNENMENVGKDNLVIGDKIEQNDKINNGILNGSEMHTDSDSKNMDNLRSDKTFYTKAKKRKIASTDKKNKKIKTKSMPKVVLKESKLVVESSVSSASPASSPMRDNSGESKSFLPLPFAEPRVVGSSSFNVSAPSFLHIPCKTEQFSFASANRTPKLLMPQGDSNIDFGELSPSPPHLNKSPNNGTSDKTILQSTYASVMVMDNQPQLTTAKVVSKSLSEHQSNILENQSSVKRPNAQRKRTSRVLNDLQYVLKNIRNDKEQCTLSESETTVEEDVVGNQNQLPDITEKDNEDTFKPPINVVPVSEKLKSNSKTYVSRRTRATIQKKDVENNVKSNTEESANEIHTDKASSSSFLNFTNNVSDISGPCLRTSDINNHASSFFNSAETSQVFANYHDQQQLHDNNKCSEESILKKTIIATGSDNDDGSQKSKRSVKQKKRNVKQSSTGLLSNKKVTDNNDRLNELKLKLKKIDSIQETPEYSIVFTDKHSAKLLRKSSTSDSLTQINNKYSHPLTISVNDNTKPVAVASENYRPSQLNISSPLEDISTLSEHLAKHSIDDSGQKRWNESAVAELDGGPPDSPTSITSKFLDISSDSEYESEHENPVVPLHIIDKNSSSCSSLASPRSTVNPFAPKSWSGDQLSHGESQGENVPNKVRNKRFRKTRSKASINPDHDGGSDADIDSDGETIQLPKTVQPPNIYAVKSANKSVTDGDSNIAFLPSAPSSVSIQSPKSQISESLLTKTVPEESQPRGDNIFSNFAAESATLQANDNISNPSQTENNSVTPTDKKNVDIKPVIDLTEQKPEQDEGLNLFEKEGDDDDRDSSEYYKSGSENSNASGNMEERALDQRMFAFNFVTKAGEELYQCSLCSDNDKVRPKRDLVTALSHVINCHCRCDVCSQSFYEVYAFQGHIWSVHTESNNLIRLSQQFAKHAVAEPCDELPPLTECVGEVMHLQTYVCLVCDRKYAKKSQVKSHAARAHFRKIHALTVLKNRKMENMKKGKARSSTSKQKRKKSS